MAACRQRLKELVAAWHRAAASAEGRVAAVAGYEVAGAPQESTATCSWTKQLR